MLLPPCRAAQIVDKVNNLTRPMTEAPQALLMFPLRGHALTLTIKVVKIKAREKPAIEAYIRYVD